MVAFKPRVKFDGQNHWFSAAFAAEVSRLKKSEVTRRALAGEFDYLPDKFGKPIWIAAKPMQDLQCIAQGFEAADRISDKTRNPVAKTKKQIEAEWLKMSKSWAGEPKDSMMTAHRIRVTLSSKKT